MDWDRSLLRLFTTLRHRCTSHCMQSYHSYGYLCQLQSCRRPFLRLVPALGSFKTAGGENGESKLVRDRRTSPRFIARFIVIIRTECYWKASTWYYVLAGHGTTGHGTTYGYWHTCRGFVHQKETSASPNFNFQQATIK